jgi:outer membrane protein assembly factor BamB
MARGHSLRAAMVVPLLLFALLTSNLMIASALSPYSHSTSPWPMFRHDVSHTGLSPFIRSPTLTRWQFSAGDWVSSSPAIGSDGTVYVGSDDQNLYAINPDGTKKWSFLTEGHVYSSPAIGSDGTIYVGSFDHRLYAIKPDGTLKWKYATGDSIYSSPAIGSDGTVYVGSFDHALYAINPSGTMKWSFITGGSIALSSPAIGSDGTIYVGSFDHKLYAINPEGTMKWSFTTGYDIESSPAIGSDGTVYVGSDDRNLYAINSDGSIKWKLTTGDMISSSPAIGSDGTVYVGSDDQNLYAVNPDGMKKWSFSTGDIVLSSPAIGSDGTIYVGSYDHTLYAINPNGTMKWNFITGGQILSSPAIGSDGTVYVGGVDNNLYAISPATLSTPAIGAVTVKCTRSSLVVGSSTVCKATMNGSSPTGLVTWFSNRPGRFSKVSCRLYRGSCSVMYTPTSAITPATITAIYSGDSYNPSSSGTYRLALTMKPTKTVFSCKQTSLFNEPSTTCTATVTGYRPTGTVFWFQAEGTGSVWFYPYACLLAHTGTSWTSGSCAVTERVTAGPVIVQAVYGGDTNNKGSTASTSSMVSNSTASTTTIVSSSSSSATVTSSTPSSGGGGIPEFPFQLGFTLLATVVIVVFYVLARQVALPRL